MALIRRFREGDSTAVVDVVRRVFEEYGFAWEPHGYCEDLGRIGEVYQAFWVVENDGIVGCVGFTEHPRIPGKAGISTIVDGVERAAASDCELHRLYVLPEARGQGLGRKLTQTVLDEARRRGRSALELWSDKKLTHAHALYEALGARKIGERICPGDPDLSPEWGFLLPID
jgi:putative acetyltransferase